YDPQPLSQNCVIEIYESSWNDGYANMGMGTILDLYDEIRSFGIYGYDFYDYGFYFKRFCGFSNPNSLEGEEGICNKYLDPQSHAPCYSGDLVIPDHVSVIHKYTFANCPGLTSIVFPSGELSIDRDVFSNCTSLKSITCKSTTPPNTSNSFADESIYNQTTLYVPYEALDAYCAHEEWGKFTHIVPFIGAGPGDINGDGKLSISDVTNIIDQLLSGDVPAYADVNGDGKVSISDVTALIDMLLKG
ncbi:MAG: leucine-rich repeat protein, partial [Muribaculaceae bacterium]|nr:leucine-rich repeat protein [Muribaculaceae bacterium]